MQQRPVLYRYIKYMMLVVHCPLLYKEVTSAIQAGCHTFVMQCVTRLPSCSEPQKHPATHGIAAAVHHFDDW